MKIGTKEYKAKRIFYRDPSGWEQLGLKLTKYTGDRERFTIPDNIIGIGGGAFAGNATLKEVAFPQTLTMIGESAFANCTRICSLALPDSILEIKKATFENCVHLTSIRLPERLLAVHHGAFRNCTRLEKLVFPRSICLIYGMESHRQLKLCSDVSSSGHSACAASDCGSSSGKKMYQKGKQIRQPSALENCSRLTDLYFLGHPPAITGDLLLDNSVVISCPKEHLTAYQRIFSQNRCQPLPY